MPFSRPRILHVISSLHTYGAQRLVASLIDGMRDDFQIAVMTMYSGSSSGASNGAGPEILDVRRRRGLRDLSFFARMVGMMREWQPAIVHTHMHNGKYWGRLAAITAGVRGIVHTEHNSDFRAWLPVQACNRALHSRTARIVAFSQDHASRIARAEGVSPEKLAVIPNGIPRVASRLSREASRRALGVHPGRKAFLHVGRFEAVKNQMLAVEAFASSPYLRRSAQLFFAGDGMDEPLVRERVVSLGLGDAIRFLGFRDDVRDLLAGADALLMTSRNEAMPLAAIEAMMAGVPIATVPWDGSVPFFRDGALAKISSSYAPHDLALAVEALVANETATAEQAQAATQTALGEYTLEVCADRHAALYRSLLA